MATYESLIKITGSVGDLVFYTLNGKNVVRKKSGFNKTAFKKSPTYEKVRQNSSEFGHCSKVGKTIRLALDPYIKAAEDPLLYQSFAKLMTEIKDLDQISVRGKRNVKNGISLEHGKEMLRRFQFGQIPNVENDFSVTFGLWENNLLVNKNLEGNEIIILTIKVDTEMYSAEKFEETTSLQQQMGGIKFEKHFSDNDLLIYFVVLKNGETILKMGFV
ncbi:hypothetical protein CEY12_02855 [Chryseobacterium sp. T16E-39]|uniref:hypothetical protein n=1 Tax=Chryseobacterium sp. T16E-39 TaxID=2015076 RepID=UPI000B5B23AB|nr:hypothetical protein [Chryseobacterium sp. T16E-39]ASK29108.1 hypothetical protein CEY12_02855 [Chryseobacterium sp. T16E-39]